MKRFCGVDGHLEGKKGTIPHHKCKNTATGFGFSFRLLFPSLSSNSSLSNVYLTTKAAFKSCTRCVGSKLLTAPPRPTPPSPSSPPHPASGAFVCVTLRAAPSSRQEVLRMILRHARVFRGVGTAARWREREKEGGTSNMSLVPVARTLSDSWLPLSPPTPVLFAKRLCGGAQKGGRKVESNLA